jgi:hypothetical protein
MENPNSLPDLQKNDENKNRKWAKPSKIPEIRKENK